MVDQLHRLNIDQLAVAKDGVQSDGGALRGCALEIHIRNDGRSKRAYFRYNGTPFGEKRTERIPLGDLALGLAKLRRERVLCEQLIEQEKSPKRYRSQQQEQRRAANMTLREALKEYWSFAERSLWQSAQTRKQNNNAKTKHLDKMAIMDMPIDIIRSHHLAEAMGDVWRTMTGTGPRIRSLLHSTFQYQIDKDDGVFRGPNPASWRKTSSLSRKLGPMRASQPWPGVHYKDVPKLVRYFSMPFDHWEPGWLTPMQAAYALHRDVKAIRSAIETGLIPGTRKAPPIFRGHSNLLPIDELKKVFGEFVYEPKPLAQESADLHTRIMRFLLFTPVRAAMACQLRWRNIKEKKGLIEYLPARDGQSSEHKLGWKYPVPYLVILTDNIHALIEAQRQDLIRDRIPITPDSFVFVHGRSRAGADRWTGRSTTHRSLDDYLSKAIARLNAAGETVELVPDGAKKATVHGLRGATFTTWTKEEGYSDDLINLSLGHIIPAIRDNKTNWHYFYNVKLIAQRAEMMKNWEKHCLRLCQPSNVVPLRSTAI